MRSTISHSIVWLAVLYLCTARLFAQPAPPEDKKALAAYTLGDKYFRAKNYNDAVNAFENGLKRPFNRLTTTLLYMDGLALFYNNQYELAIERFQKLANTYRKSLYVPEANYHKALAMLRLPDKHDGGVYLLLNLSEQSPSPTIKDNALNALQQHFFFEADTAYLRKYYDAVRASFKPLVMEALCYQLHKAGRNKEVQRLLAAFRQRNGALTPRLQKLVEEPPVKPARTDVRIALLMPFMAAEQDTLTQPARISLEILEGMRTALQQDSFPRIRSVSLLVVDTDADTARIDKQWREQVLPFKPDLVIGEYKNRQCAKIATLAEAAGIPQLVPLSPAEELILGKKNIFLANPSQSTAARVMGEYARQRMGHSRFMVVYDESRASLRQADAFTEGARNPMGYVLRRRVSSSKDIAIVNMDEVSRHLQRVYYHAVFMPLTNEEVVSYGLFSFRRDSIDANTQVYGMDGWQYYTSLDDETKQTWRTVISDPYYQGIDAAGYARFQRAYRSSFQAPPSKYAVQGYDIMRFVLNAYGQYKAPIETPEATNGPPPATEPLHRMLPFRGLNQYYFFGGQNDNQRVQLLQYLDGDLIKLRSW
jgi:ABC-type branched-subunit amino acid transport system substrate-binding protein